MIFFILLLVACTNSQNQSNLPEIFSNIQVYNLDNGGTRAVISVDINAITDENLIEFVHSYLVDTDFAWVALDFGNGEGYLFSGGGIYFDHIYQHEEDWSFSDSDKLIGVGTVFEI
ncbi:MAG: hypothetical protein FWG64_02895 [Firmicutes bacterium]|nr:hypothetical protein [Bacillota bacterium]